MQRIGKLLLVLGFLLILSSCALLIASQMHTQEAQEENAQLVQILDGLLPEAVDGIMESRSNRSMPALEIDGEDYVALVEIPALGLRLPVADTWDKKVVTSRPCRFYGSAYDGSLIIGGSDRTGQFAGFTQLPFEAEVTVTDMTGAVFTYMITDIQRPASADAQVLLDSDAHLSLFVRNAYGTDYILLRCTMR